MSKRHGTSDIAAELEIKKANLPEFSSDAGLSSAKDISETEQRAVVEERTEENFLQMLIVGSKKCGKTQLVMTYLNQSHFFKLGLKMLSKQYLADIKCEESTIQAMIWDLDSDDKFLDCRKEAYSEADIILLCFDKTNRYSFNEVSSKWHKEIKNHCSDDKPVILVGLKAKLMLSSAIPNPPRLVKIKEGQILQRSLKLDHYMEVNSVSQPDVRNLFEYAAQMATQKGICVKATITAQPPDHS